MTHPFVQTTSPHHRLSVYHHIQARARRAAVRSTRVNAQLSRPAEASAHPLRDLSAPCQPRRPETTACGEPSLRRRALLAAPALLSPALQLILTAPAAAAAPSAPALLHVVLQVSDMEAAARDFCESFGMRRVRERPGNIFVGYGGESGGANFVIELYTRDPAAAEGAGAQQAGPAVDPFGGLVVAVPNPPKAAAAAAAAGARRAAGGARCSGDAIAGCAALGPEGVPVRFAKAGTGLKAPLCRIVLNTTDLKAAVAFYEGALGLRQLPGGKQLGVIDRLAEDPAQPAARALLAFGGKNPSAAIELREVKSVRPASVAFDKIAVGVPDLAAAASRVAAFAGSGGGGRRGALAKEPFAVPGIGTRVALVADPDGHTLALVDFGDFEKELL